MDIRLTHESSTPESRLAAIAKGVLNKFHPNLFAPDYKDFEDAMRIYMLREMTCARIEEARKCAGLALTHRIGELSQELDEIDRQIQREERLPHGA